MGYKDDLKKINAALKNPKGKAYDPTYTGSLRIKFGKQARQKPPGDKKKKHETQIDVGAGKR